MPVNFATEQKNVLLINWVEYVAYQLDTEKKDFLDVTVAGVFDAQEPSDISTLIAGIPEGLSDRSNIWQPDQEQILPRLLTRKSSTPLYGTERKDGSDVRAEIYFRHFLEHFPVKSVNLNSVNHPIVREIQHPSDKPFYTLSTFKIDEGYSLITFGYTTKEGIMREDEQSVYIGLDVNEGVVGAIQQLRQPYNGLCNVWNTHQKMFLGDSHLNNKYTSPRDDTHLLIFTASGYTCSIFPFSSSYEKFGVYQQIVTQDQTLAHMVVIKPENKSVDIRVNEIEIVKRDANYKT